MKRLRRQFAIFAIVLVAGFVVVVARSFRQVDREERDLARGYAEQVFEQVQSRLDALLEAEAGRPFGEFRFFQAATGERAGEPSLARSPLSRLPRNDEGGLVGYFQIDPSGSFTTPHLPAGTLPRSGLPAEERSAREERHALLARLTTSFQARMTEGATRSDTGGGAPTAVDLGATSKDLMVEDLGYLEEKAALRNRAREDARRRKIAESRLLSRGEAPTAEELRVFEEQTRSVADPGTPLPASVRGARAVSIDPFQARLVEKRFIVFYRKLWLDRTLYLQGFVLDGPQLFDSLMAQTFARSPLAGHGVASLILGNDELVRYGSAVNVLPGEPPLFERSLDYPLNLFVWRVRSASYPRLAARDALSVLAILGGAILALGLASIYRTASTEVRLSQKRQDLVSAVTHELRTPLTSIRMYAEMLEEGMATDDAKRSEYYGQISRESARLSRLIENVLQLARLEKGTYRVDAQVREPSADFSEICRELTPLAERQGFHLTSTAPPGPLPVIAYDPDAIRQVFLSFLDNSVKFAAGAAERVFEVSLAAEGETVVWAWSDRGPGVPRAELGRIFETFYRVEGEATRRTKGTGIGLAIARMLAEAMGARIEARNRPAADGGGLEIRLVFRVAGTGGA